MDDNSREEEELEKAFTEAANYVTAHPTIGNQDTNILLDLYAYYKQVTSGPCQAPRPSWYQRIARSKHDAWSSLGSLSKEKSMKAYIEIVDQLAPEWRTSDGDGSNDGYRVSVSRFANQSEDPPLSDSDKSIFDWVKEGNLTQVIEMVQKKPGLIGITDEEGMNLLHWASDRGHVEILRTLCERFGSDINVRDAFQQTPLHYAASCGHRNVIELLLQLGIDSKAKDVDGATAAEVAHDSEIAQLLSKD